MTQAIKQIKVWQPRGFEGLELTELNANHNICFNAPISIFTFGVRLEGVRQTQYQGTDRITSVNDYTIYQPGEILIAKPHSEGRYRYKSMSLSETFLNDLLREELKRPASSLSLRMMLEGSLNERFAQMYLGCHDSFGDGSSSLERESRLLMLLRKTMQYFVYEPNPVFQAKRHIGLEHRAVTAIKNHLRQKHTKEVSLADLSSLTNLNKWYLLEVFKNQVGISPHQYQTSLRIELAKKLLRAQFSGTHVALETGFADHSHFIRTFKKYVWVTPAQYQKDSLR